MNEAAVGVPAPDSRAARALRYIEIVTEITAAAKLPGHRATAWDRLAPLVAADAFRLFGRGKQEMDWPAAVSAMERWARATAFSATVRRLDEAGRLVFMELDERITVQGQSSSRRSMTVFAFDAADRICRLDAFQ